MIKLGSRTAQKNKFFYGLRDFKAPNRDIDFKYKVFKVKESIYNKSHTDDEYGQLPFILYHQVDNLPRYGSKFV